MRMRRLLTITIAAALLLGLVWTRLVVREGDRARGFVDIPSAVPERHHLLEGPAVQAQATAQLLSGHAPAEGKLAVVVSEGTFHALAEGGEPLSRE